MRYQTLRVIAKQITLIACAIGFLVWWTHAALNHLFPPNETTLDEVLYMLASVSKLALLLSLPFFLRRLLHRMDHNKRFVRRCVLHWLLGFVVLLSVLTWFHDAIAETLSNDTTRFYYVSEASPLNAFHYVGRAEWLQRWNSGMVIGLEAALGALVIATLSGFGYWYGRKKGAFLVLSLVLVVIITAWPIMFGLLVPDYDFFLGGIFSDSLALDLMWPFTAIDPTTELTFTVLLVFVVASTLASRAPELAVEAREPSNPLSSTQVRDAIQCR